MNTIGIATRGIEPLRPTLDAIAAAGTTADLVRVFGATDRRTGIAPFAVSPSVDPKNSNETILSAGEGGLGLPEREYYLKTDARSGRCGSRMPITLRRENLVVVNGSGSRVAGRG
jgi:putative endopeptidase